MKPTKSCSVRNGAGSVTGIREKIDRFYSTYSKLDVDDLYDYGYFYVKFRTGDISISVTSSKSNLSYFKK